MPSSIASAAAVVLAASAGLAVAGPAERAADLDALADRLPDAHVDFFADLDREAWQRAVEDLSSRIVAMDDEQALFELAALAALAGDPHTSIDYQSSATELRAIPLGLEAFEDGVFVVVAGPLESAYLEHEVEAVNGTPIEEAIRRLGRLAAADNDGALRRKACQLLVLRGALLAAGLATAEDRVVNLTLRPRGSDEAVEREVRFADAATLPMISWRKAPDFAAVRPPMYLRRATGNYQSDYDEASRTLYVAYNRCQQAADLPMERFTQLVLGYWERLRPARLLIDLRHNGGGDERVLHTFISAIDGHPEIDRPGALYVAIGPRTFSSAVNNAVTLDQKTAAILVGEPTGGSPNHFGELQSFLLPSGTKVWHSTRRFNRVEGDPDAVMPEMPAPRTSEAWFAGRDPVLEAVATGDAGAGVPDASPPVP